jgi:anti-sigma factor RsiW
MNCQSFSDDLTAYLDGELPLARAEEISAHLRDCGPCSEELRELRRAGEFVEAHSLSLEPPSHLWNNLRGRIGSLPEQRAVPGLFQSWFGQRWLAAAASVAAAAAIVLGIWGYLGYRQSEQSLQEYMTD